MGKHHTVNEGSFNEGEVVSYGFHHDDYLIGRVWTTSTRRSEADFVEIATVYDLHRNDSYVVLKDPHTRY